MVLWNMDVMTREYTCIWIAFRRDVREKGRSLNETCLVLVKLSVKESSEVLTQAELKALSSLQERHFTISVQYGYTLDYWEHILATKSMHLGLHIETRSWFALQYIPETKCKKYTVKCRLKDNSYIICHSSLCLPFVLLFSLDRYANESV